MDRRTFVTTGAWFGATGCLSPWIAHAAAHPAGTIAVFDSTLAHGRAFADYAARANLPTFAVGDDIGALWYTTLAPRLVAQTQGALIGVTCPSDFFVLTQLVPDAARVTRSEISAARQMPIVFVIALHAAIT
jgi:hypothetical protein